MHINIFADSPELTAMRESLFYTRLRPYVSTRVAENGFTGGRQIREETETQLSVEDRYFIKLDILLGQLFKNCKTRQFWKQILKRLSDDETVSCLSIEALEKAYLNELVFLFERLASFASLLRKSYGANIDVDDIEMRLLVFFNPLLFTKRNYAQHRLYLGFPGMARLQLLEEQVSDEKSFDVYYAEFETRLNEVLEWITYTEQKHAVFLKDFLELVHSKIQRDGAYLAPTCLAPNFSISDRLDENIRKRHDHKKVFTKHNSKKT